MDQMKIIDALYPLITLLFSAFLFVASIAFFLFHYWKERQKKSLNLASEAGASPPSEETQTEQPKTDTPSTTTGTMSEEEMKSKKEKDDNNIIKDQIAEAVTAGLTPLNEQLTQIQTDLALIAEKFKDPNEKDGEGSKDVKDSKDVEDDGNRDTLLPKGGENGDTPPTDDEKLLGTVRKDIENVLMLMNTFLNKMETISDQITSMPETFQKQLENHAREEKQRKQIAQQQQRDERKKKEQEEHDKLRATRQGELAGRFDRIKEDSNIFKIATILKGITEGLQNMSENYDMADSSFPQYLQLLAQTEELESKFDGLNNPVSNPSQAMPDDLEEKVNSWEELFENIATSHKPVQFINLLEDASRHPALQKQTDTLKDLLNLEDIHVEPKMVLKGNELDIIEITNATGDGNKPVVAEVLERGYRVKDNNVVIKKPKVTVHMEN